MKFVQFVACFIYSFLLSFLSPNPMDDITISLSSDRSVFLYDRLKKVV